MSSEILEKVIEPVLRDALLKLAVGTEYRGESARPSKFAARALAWREIGSPDKFTVWESNSFPGVLAVFYLTLGATVHLNDPDEKLARRVHRELSEGYGERVKLEGDMTEAKIIDLDPLGLPPVEQLKEASTTKAVLVVTDGTGGARKSNGPIPHLFRELAGSPEGRWEKEKRSYKELWRAVAKALDREFVHFVEKAGGSPACYVVLR